MNQKGIKPWERESKKTLKGIGLLLRTHVRDGGCIVGDPGTQWLMPDSLIECLLQLVHVERLNALTGFFQPSKLGSDLWPWMKRWCQAQLNVGQCLWPTQ